MENEYPAVILCWSPYYHEFLGMHSMRANGLWRKRKSWYLDTLSKPTKSLLGKLQHGGAIRFPPLSFDEWFSLVKKLKKKKVLLNVLMITLISNLPIKNIFSNVTLRFCPQPLSAITHFPIQNTATITSLHKNSYCHQRIDPICKFPNGASSLV